MSIEICKDCDRKTDTDKDEDFYEHGEMCKFCFAEAALDPEQLGFSVSAHVRDKARATLGIPPCETVEQSK